MKIRVFVTLTYPGHSPIVVRTQAFPSITAMADNPLTALEAKIDELIGLCQQLNRENSTLKAENASFQPERRDLLAQNEQARTRVEAVLDRLRSMEQAS